MTPTVEKFILAVKFNKKVPPVLKNGVTSLTTRLPLTRKPKGDLKSLFDSRFDALFQKEFGDLFGNIKAFKKKKKKK